MVAFEGMYWAVHDGCMCSLSYFPLLGLCRPVFPHSPIHPKDTASLEEMVPPTPEKRGYGYGLVSSDP